MADRNTNRQYDKSNEDYRDASGMSWGRKLSTHEYDGHTVVKVFNPTSTGYCYGAGGPAEWLTVIDGIVVGSEATKRRAKLIGDAIVNGDIEDTGDTGGRLESYLIGMAVWNYEGPAPTDEQQREIDALLKD